MSQLFPDKSNDDGYKAYFGLFNDGKLLVDKNSQYTKITKADNNKLVLQFDLNDKNLDEDYNKELTIPLEKILVNGKINTDSFELELKAKVKNIIDSNPELFAA
ncbi:hypothetical protein KBA84_01500 [Patescibacteria group bacterium]|nr:hypothetical protein [Patescibacteria group bacterium]